MTAAPAMAAPVTTSPPPHSGSADGGGSLANILGPDSPLAPLLKLLPTGSLGTGKVVDATTTLAGPATAKTGKKASFTATVTPSSSTGKVQFKVDNKAVGAQIPVVGGTAKTDLTFDKAGAKSVTAVFVGADGKEYASAPHTVTVTK
ncbi:Ig-like domain-containing protein [Rhodococcus sp. NPDC055112]